MTLLVDPTVETVPDISAEDSDPQGELPRDGRGRRILVDQVREHPVNLDDPHAERAQVAKTRHRVTERLNADGTVTLVYASSKLTKGKTAPYIRGEAREQKTFARWTTAPLISLTDRGDGSWLVREQSGYQKKVGGRKIWVNTGFRSRIVLAEHLDRGLAGPALLTDAAVRHLGRPKGFRDYYPLMGHYAPNFSLPINVALGSHPTFASGPVRLVFSRSTDVRTLTTGLFGKSRFRKDLMKSVAMADLTRIEMAWQFRGLVPIDWIIAYLRRPPVAPNEQSRLQGVNLRPYLRQLDQQSLKNLLYGPDPDHMRYFTDIVRGNNPAAAAHVGRVQSWQHLHDQIARYNRTHRHTGGKRLPKMRLTNAQKAITATSTDGLGFTVATHEDQLWEWGTEMNHCILDYGRQMRQRTSWLGAVRTADGTLVANFELRPETRLVNGNPEGKDTGATLRQLLGKNNSPLDDSLRERIEDHLARCGVDVEVDYWGSGRNRHEARVRHQQAQIQAQAEIDEDDDDDQYEDGNEAF